MTDEAMRVVTRVHADAVDMGDMGDGALLHLIFTTAYGNHAAQPRE